MVTALRNPDTGMLPSKSIYYGQRVVWQRLLGGLWHCLTYGARRPDRLLPWDEWNDDVGFARQYAELTAKGKPASAAVNNDPAGRDHRKGWTGPAWDPGDLIAEHLTWRPDGWPSEADVLIDRWWNTDDELPSCSSLEQASVFVGGVRYVFEATYQQPMNGEADDEHARHDFDAWCYGIARLQALQTPRLTPAHCRGQTGRDDASNGAGP